MRFLVIGAGIAGLATAVAVRRAGHDVQVLEQRPDTGTGAGISIWPNALAALDVLGLGDEVRAAGGRVGAGAVRWHDGRWLRRPTAGRMERALGEPLVVIHRRALTDILGRGLPATTVTRGVTATGLMASAEGVRVTLADGSVLGCDAVVGADGVDSMVARRLNGTLRRRYTGYTAWRGIAAHELDPDLAGETIGPGLQFGHVPLGASEATGNMPRASEATGDMPRASGATGDMPRAGGATGQLTYWFATQRVPSGQSSAIGELAHLGRVFGSWPHPIPALLAATAEDAVLRNDLYDRVRADCWATDRVVLVGDAAHPMRPHLGQGGCQGLEDAAILGALTAGCTDPGAAFRRFAAFRRGRVRNVVAESRMIGQVVNMRPTVLGAVASRASTLVPEALLVRHLRSVAGRSAFVLPS